MMYIGTGDIDCPKKSGKLPMLWLLQPNLHHYFVLGIAIADFDFDSNPSYAIPD